MAYALGPNYNKPWEAFDPVDLSASVSRAFAASAAAASHASGAPGVERALVQALAARYPSAEPAADCSAWSAGYAAAMRGVYQAYPDDLDVAALFADALMNLTPWALWDQVTGEPAAGAGTIEAKEVLERALTSEGGRAHPGVLHMYIHLMEMSAHPEDALRAGDSLRDLVPDAGHLRHMPTHLDVLCGDYRQVVSSNTAAIAADEKFLAREGAMNFYTLYRAHNYHFKIYGAMFVGQTSRGPGCSPPGTPTVHCCLSRAGPRKPSRYTGPILALMTPWPGPASIRATCGACTATTSACSGWASTSWPGSSSSSSRSPARTPTCRSGHPAIAGWFPPRAVPSMPGADRRSAYPGRASHHVRGDLDGHLPGRAAEQRRGVP